VVRPKGFATPYPAAWSVNSFERSVMIEFAEGGGVVRLNKVPDITLSFWIIKIMSTTVGETGADYLAVHVSPGSTG
jgi:hypothetical protein